ncbi:MAG: hypothetical protein PSX81_02715 [bacterium]|nr:hypothetical protein [bacterium]
MKFLKRTKSLTITYPIGTNAGVQETNFSLDKDMDTVEAIGFTETSGSAAQAYKIGLKNTNNGINFIDPIDKNFLLAANSQKIDDRFYRPGYIEAAGKQITVQIEFAAISTVAITVNVAFEQQKKLSD